MALEKTVTTEQGIVVTHWSIGGMPAYNRHTKTATFILHGYLNEETRKAGKQPVLNYEYAVNNETIEPLTTKRNMTLAERRELDRFRKIDEAFLTEWRKNDAFKKFTSEELAAKEAELLAHHNNIYLEISDEELMKLDLTVVEVNLGHKVKYFDEFEKVFNEKGWQAACYNFLRTNTTLKEFFADAMDA